MKRQNGKSHADQARAWLATWGPALLWMGLIFLLSSRPTLPELDDPGWDLLLKKAGHFVVFDVLAWLYARALHRDVPFTSKKLWLAWGMAVLYAVTDEVHQGFVPGRNPRLTDLLIDAAGAATSLLLASVGRGSLLGGSTLR